MNHKLKAMFKSLSITSEIGDIRKEDTRCYVKKILMTKIEESSRKTEKQIDC